MDGTPPIAPKKFLTNQGENTLSKRLEKILPLMQDFDCLVEMPAPYTALRGSAFLQSEASPQVVSEAKDNFRKDDDVRWQPSGAHRVERDSLHEVQPARAGAAAHGKQIAKGNPQGERGGVHQFGGPPKGNANFAWVQHFIHHLAQQGMAGFVLANGSMSSNQSGDCPARSAMKTPKAKPQSLPRQRDIRQKLIEADLVDCMVALPGQLFYSTQIPVCLWFLAKNKNADAKRDFRDRRKQTLFIDARKLGTLIDRVHRELTDADLENCGHSFASHQSRYSFLSFVDRCFVSSSPK